MAENGASSIVGKTEEESIRPPNPLLSILSKFTQVFNFRFPPPSTAEKDAGKVGTEMKGNGDSVMRSGEVVEVSKKPVSARFPDAGTTAVPPLKLEGEEMEQDTNPVVLWQVYAIGGFFVLRWALARWKERRANNNKSSNAADSPPPPGGGADDASE